MRSIDFNDQEIEEFLEIAIPICTSSKVMLMNKFIQHGQTTCLEHCIAVAFNSFVLANKLGASYDKKSLIRGALLHDYFLYDWHEPHGRWHGFTHPGIALKNANHDFDLNEVEQNLIVRHMFPLVPVPPTCLEGGVVCLVDKWCSLKETFSLKPYKDDKIVLQILGIVNRKLEEEKRRENIPTWGEKLKIS